MDARKFGGNLMLLAAAGIVASIIWWWSFYRQVVTFLSGPSTPLPLDCLYMKSGSCGFVSSVAGAVGYWPYDPTLLWASGMVFVIGAIIVASAEDGKHHHY